MSTITDMQAGAWLDGYQAVSPAPVELSPGERKRHFGEAYVTGAWSDPWWMYDPERGWAVAVRWRNKAQQVFLWPQRRFEDVPAIEERVLRPWAPEPARELVTA